MSLTPSEQDLAFLNGGGAMSPLIAKFDWARTPLGSITDWPPYLRSATALMLCSQVPIVMLWGETGVMIYNDAYSVFAAGRHPSLLGSNVREGWEEVAAFNDKVMRVGLAGGTLSYQDQELTLYRNGRAEQVWMNLDYSPLLDEGGRPAGVMALVVETTGKVQAQRALARQREQFAQLFEQAPTFMTMLSGPDHRIELANPNYLALIGHRPVLGRTVAEALPDAVAQGYLALLDQVFASGEAYSAVGSKYAVQAEPGGAVDERFLDFVFQPIRGASAEVTGIFVQGVDVTRRMQAQVRRDALIRLSEGLRDLAEPGDLAGLAVELVGETLSADRVSYASLGPADPWVEAERAWVGHAASASDAWLSASQLILIEPMLLRGDVVAIAELAEHVRALSLASQFGSLSVRSIAAVPVLANGLPHSVMLVQQVRSRHWTAEELGFIQEAMERTQTAVERARVMIELRTSEMRLREANETLEAKVDARTRELLDVEARFRQAQKMEAIGQLTGGIAHDFNNLLAGIGASLQVLQRRLGGPGENTDRYIGMAQDGVRRAASLTQRLLAFSRRQTLDPRPTDVNRLVAGFADMIRRTVGPSIDLEVSEQQDLWITRVDTPQLEGALLNLCINARDAMSPNGGQLTVTTANEELGKGHEEDRELPPGEYVTVSVSDTGVGMTAEVMGRAFDPFFTTKPIGQGTGLGLSMVYGFVRQSGGGVKVRSQVGRGTVVRLYLPRFHGEFEPESAAPSSPRTDEGQGERVLMIEDEETIRSLLFEELGAAGYRVTAVQDGATGLEILQSKEPVDLLLTDVGLPGGLNGRQVADAARVARPGLRVLFVTGYAESEAVRNGLLESGMEVITKPFDIDVLIRRVREMLK